jgi:hypothetical protein
METLPRDESLVAWREHHATSSWSNSSLLGIWISGWREGGGRCVGDGQTLPRDESLITRREHHATSVEFLLVRDLDFREAGGVSETARAPAFEVRA